METPDHIHTVSEITALITHLLRGQFPMVAVEGEISNFRVSPAGHAYFRLKDDQATISAVMFRWPLSRLRFKPEDGMRVIVQGPVDVYPPQGAYQVKAETMREVGVGDLHRRFLELKEKLEREGLFAPERKRPIPPLPRRIGVVTSPSGAAIRDILHVLRRRFHGLEIVLAPCRVQGAEAPGEIVQGIRNLERLGVDVMIVGRGGGSLEDLMAFNDERVARAIHACEVPIISAVGHEIDFTIADFVADLRAPTPSAAAEVVVQEQAAVVERIVTLQRRLVDAVRRQTDQARLRLSALTESYAMTQPLARVHHLAQRVDELTRHLQRETLHGIAERRSRLERLRSALRNLDPGQVMARGYSVVTDESGAVIRDAAQTDIGRSVHIRLHRGALDAEVTRREE